MIWLSTSNLQYISPKMQVEVVSKVLKERMPQASTRWDQHVGGVECHAPTAEMGNGVETTLLANSARRLSSTGVGVCVPSPKAVSPQRE